MRGEIGGENLMMQKKKAGLENKSCGAEEIDFLNNSWCDHHQDDDDAGMRFDDAPLILVTDWMTVPCCRTLTKNTTTNLNMPGEAETRRIAMIRGCRSEEVVGWQMPSKGTKFLCCTCGQSFHDDADRLFCSHFIRIRERRLKFPSFPSSSRSPFHHPGIMASELIPLSPSHLPPLRILKWLTQIMTQLMLCMLNSLLMIRIQTDLLGSLWSSWTHSGVIISRRFLSWQTSKQTTKNFSSDPSHLLGPNIDFASCCFQNMVAIIRLNADSCWSPKA